MALFVRENPNNQIITFADNPKICVIILRCRERKQNGLNFPLRSNCSVLDCDG